MKNTLFIIALISANSFFSQNRGVGINTTTPQEILHVKGAFRFEPTNIANPAVVGKALVSDANGVATWQNADVSTIPSVVADFSSTGLTRNETAAYMGTINENKTSYYYTGTSITLGPGKWIVSIAMNLNIANTSGGTIPANQSIWMRSTFFDTNTDGQLQDNHTLDIIGSPLISREIMSPNQNTIASGELIINNTLGINKTYYYLVKLQKFGNTQNVTVYNFAGAPTSASYPNNAVNKIVAISADK